MRHKNNPEVVESWVKGEPATNQSHVLTTDGLVLRSYDILIGHTHGGKKHVLMFEKESYLTRAISAHVEIASQAEGVVLVKPDPHMVNTLRMKVRLRKEGHKVAF